MIDEFAKEHLHGQLRFAREALVWKLDGLSEYDIRRPLTATGTNLLGLIKHLAIWESRYFGEVFSRPFPEPLPRWNDETLDGTEFWAAADETREDITGFYRRVWEHSDATINALAIDAPGYVPWWDTDVMLFNMTVPTGKPGVHRSSRPPGQPIQPTADRQRGLPRTEGTVVLLTGGTGNGDEMSAKRIAILGAGDVAGTLGSKWLAAGHQVVFGVRNPDSEKVTALRARLEEQTEVDTIAGRAGRQRGGADRRHRPAPGAGG
jgi:hypothetical protein